MPLHINFDIQVSCRNFQPIFRATGIDNVAADAISRVVAITFSNAIDSDEQSLVPKLQPLLQSQVLKME